MNDLTRNVKAQAAERRTYWRLEKCRKIAEAIYVLEGAPPSWIDAVRRMSTIHGALAVLDRPDMETPNDPLRDVALFVERGFDHEGRPLGDVEAARKAIEAYILVLKAPLEQE